MRTPRNVLRGVRRVRLARRGGRRDRAEPARAPADPARVPRGAERRLESVRKFLTTNTSRARNCMKHHQRRPSREVPRFRGWAGAASLGGVTTPTESLGGIERPLSIHKRPSGGRGEYELVGRDPRGQVSAADLDGAALILETPFGTKNSNVRVGTHNGKLRLRLISPGVAPHLALQVPAMLLMPESIRDETKISRALPVLLQKRYVLDIGLEFLRWEGTSAAVRPTQLTARSGDIGNTRTRQIFSFRERSRQVKLVHDNAESLPQALEILIRRHQEACNGAIISQSISKLVHEIMESLEVYDDLYLPGADPLESLLVLAGVDGYQSTDVPPPPETPADDPQVRLRSEHIYRLRRTRGASAGRFRVQVQQAYDYRCAFCGFRAPAVVGQMTSGVDAAHILPWGAYDLDIPQNGLILCKQHHWAFDNRVLRIDPVTAGYQVELTEIARSNFASDPVTLAALEAVTGRISEERLPSKRALYPSRKFIDEFNSLAIEQ